MVGSRTHSRETARPSELRCAIYTRKSSEEGLEQEFNSLHAQREACLAYILSQRHEGWRALPSLYDDGGVSGGTMDRPALLRLLDDIRAKRVDLIVIYKVDRLTRSLADFAKLVDVFNAHDVSFVSVTQQFNTATSMGRLTLNMLLSFAQFEREVTGERIRDKIAASKRKGMWMGGYPPLGYDVRDRKLVVNEAEASKADHIFRTYLKLGSVRQLAEQLKLDGITTKRRQTTSGPYNGGRPFMRGNLYEMLQNNVYRGKVAHKGNVYEGEHAAIIDSKLWEAVQAKLREHRVERSAQGPANGHSLLAGLAYDAKGDRLTPTHARKGAKRYRYYVSEMLITGARENRPDGQRIPAGELDGLVTDAITNLIGTPTELHQAVCCHIDDVARQKQLLASAMRFSNDLHSLPRERLHSIIRAIVSRIDVHAQHIDITVMPIRIIDILLDRERSESSGDANAATPPHYVITVQVSLKRAGQEMRLVVAGVSKGQGADPTLFKLIGQALQFKNQLLSSQDEGIAELAACAGISGSHFTRVMRLGFLAPDILTAMAEGRQPVNLTATRLLKDTRFPLCWDAQRKLLGFPQAT